MKPRLLAVLAIGLAVIGGVLVWQLDTLPHAVTASSPNTPALPEEHPAPPSVPPQPPPARPAAAAPKLTVETQPPADDEPHGLAAPAEIARALGEARHQLLLAAHPCSAAARLDPRDGVRLRLTLVHAGGSARLDDATILDGTLSDEPTRRCIVDAVRAARWSTSDGDRRLAFEAQLTLAELKEP